MIVGCCEECDRARGMGAMPSGMGFSLSDLNPISLVGKAASSFVDAVGGVANSVVTQVDRVTKVTLGTALAAGQTVRGLSTPATQTADVPETNYLPIAVGGGAAVLLLLLATRRKKKAA